MILGVVGINHQSASVDVRSHFVFDSQNALVHSQALMAQGILSEIVLLSTCNRTELYYQSERPLTFSELMIGRLTAVASGCSYAYESAQAVRHLMRVACGLDSLIMGEGEILGQVKQAYRLATDAGTVGKTLSRLFETTLALAKQVRSNRDMSRYSVSLVQVAAKLWQPIFSDISQITVLLVGAGKIAQRIVRQLVCMGISEIMIANRSKESALELAAQFAVKAKTAAFGLTELSRYLDQADIVIGATSSSVPLVHQSLVEKALIRRKRKPMLMLDLAVPRNIEAGVGDLEDVYLYCLDDLQRVLQKHQSLRQVAALKAERFIREATMDFMRWLQAQDSFKTVAVFRGQFDRIRDDCLAQSLKRLQLGDDPEKILKRLAHDLTNQFLHKPTHRLRVAGLKGEHSLCNIIRDLFELNHESFSTE